MTAEVGSIIGYLRLDRSDWDNELRAAGRKADELARHNPDIRIRTNAPTAIAQLSAVAVAVKRLQDAQGAEAVAEARLNALRAKGITDGPKVAAAENAVEKARRAQALATIQLADANDKNTQAMAKAAAEANKLGQAADQAGNKVQFSLVGALAAVAPAAVPIAAVAGGALLGLIPVAATVMLGIKGISNEMKSGALQGSQFATEVARLKTEVTHLEQVSAAGIMSGLTQALGSSHGLFQVINQDIGVMSGQLGQIIGGLGPGLLRIFTDLNPLFVTFGQALVNGAHRLESWATSSNGVSKFVAYVQTELPPVLHFMGELVTLLGHLAAAAAPFGGVVLNELTLFVGVLNRIPVPLLQQAIPVAVALYGALKVYQLITPGVTALNAALGLTGPKAVAAAAAQKAAALQVEAAAAQEAAAVAASKAEEATAASEAAVSIAASAESTGSVLAAGAAASAEAAATFAAAMQMESTEAASTAASISASATAAAAASDAAAAEIAASSRAAAVGWTAALGPIGALAAGAALLIPAFMNSGKAAQEAAAQVNTYTEAIKADSGAIGENTRMAAVKALSDAGALAAADKLGISVKTVTDAVLGNIPAQSQLTDRLDAWRQSANHNAVTATQYMGSVKKLQNAVNDQSGDVQKSVQTYKLQTAAMGAAASGARSATVADNAQVAALAALNTKLGNFVTNALAAAQSEDQFHSAVINVTQSVKNNGVTLSQNTSKGLANRDALLAAMQAALSLRDAQEKSGTSTAKANLTLAANVRQLEQTAIQSGLSKGAVYALVRQMGLVPKNIETKVTAATDPALARLRALQSYIHSHSWTVTVGVNASGQTVKYIPGSGLVTVPSHHATGGLITGPGTATSDSIPAMLSTGEFVVNAAATAKNRGVLNAINAGATAPTGTAGAAQVAAAIAAATRPAPTTVGGTSALLAAHQAGAVGYANTAGTGLANWRALTAQLRDVTKATDGQVAAAKHASVQAGIAATKAKRYAQALPSATAAERANKAAAEAHATALAHEATTADHVARQVEKAAQRKVAAVSNAASRAKAAYDKEAAAAKASSAVAVQAAQSVVQAYQQQVSDFISEAGTLKQGLLAGSSVSSIWEQMLGVTDANGNPVPATLGALQTSEEAVLSQLTNFRGDLDKLTAAGANNSLIQELLGIQSQSGTSGADQLAQQLLAGGSSAIDSLQSVMGQLSDTANSESDTLAQQFYGVGANSLDQMGKGLVASFPALQKAIAPILAQLEKQFTITPTVDLSQLGTVGAAVGALGSSSKSKPGKGVMTPYIPGFASGVTDFAGGLAYVHAGELLVNMPKGTDVVPASRVRAGDGAALNLGPLLSEVRALRAEVRAQAAATAAHLAPVVVGAAKGHDAALVKRAIDHERARSGGTSTAQRMYETTKRY